MNHLPLFLLFTRMNLNNNHLELSTRDLDRIISMAWEDRTPFEAIAFQFKLEESEVIELMRRELKPKSFKRWRKRVSGRASKHLKKREIKISRFKSKAQRAISQNKISKKKYH